MNVVVWEWDLQSYLPVWVPYGPDVSCFLEENLKKGKDVVDLRRVDAVLSYEVSLKNYTQTRIETGTVRKIKRSVYPSSYPCASGILWEWFSDYGWSPYDMETAKLLEMKRSKGSSKVDLEKHSLGIPNYVDLKNDLQVNKYTLVKRPIQRRVARIGYPSDTGPSSTFYSSSLTSAHGSSSPNKHLVSSLSVPSRVPSKSSGYKSSSPSNASHPYSSSPSKTSLAHSSSLPKNQKGSFGTTQSTTSQYLPSSIGTASGTNPKDKKKSTEMKRKKAKLHDDPLSTFCRDTKESTDEECSICFEKLKDVSGFHDNSSKSPDSDVKELKNCKHKFHGTCLLELIKSGSKNGWIQCPTCKAIHGVKHGNQPKDGTMDVSKSSHSLPGFPGYGMIIITYDFRTGMQDKEHPHPGKLYYASGFPRICYLPDNEKGQKVLKLLRKAWKRRLIFTIATSNTTGQEDTVVWNEIHHKTEAFSNISGHGFPDPNYLDNVLAELSVQGVDDSDDDDGGGDDDDDDRAQRL